MSQVIQNTPIKILPCPTMKKNVYKAIEKALQNPPKPHLLVPDLPSQSVPVVAPTPAPTPAVLVAPTPAPDNSTPTTPVVSAPATPAPDNSTPVVSSAPTPASTASQVSKVQILDYDDEEPEDTSTPSAYEIGLIDEQVIEKNCGYKYEITTQNTKPIQYIDINLVSKEHLKYLCQIIPYSDDNIYNVNIATVEIRNLDKNKDYHFSIQYIAYF
jgi:hypothetical protein